MAQVRPHQVYDFTAFSVRTPGQQQPGDRLDAQFRAHADAIGALQVEVERLRAGLARAAAPREPTLSTPSLYVNAGGPYAGDDKGATATSADYAQVAIDWAEHMPDTIPANTLAVTGVTGSHWSSRWWANQTTSQLANYLPVAGGTMTGRLVIPVVADLSVGGGATGQVLTAASGGLLSWSTPSGTFIDAPSNSQYYSRYNGAWVVSPGGLTDAPNDATAYGRKSQAWSHLTHADITDWSAAVATAPFLPLAGGTLTGPLAVTGGNVTITQSGTSAAVEVTNSAGACYFYIDNTGTSRLYSNVGAPGPTQLYLDPTGFVGCSQQFYPGTGFGLKPGSSGVKRGGAFNIDFNISSSQLWVDVTNLGTFAFTSDYRIKKDVADLPSTWERVKALRPISYTQAEFHPSWEGEKQRDDNGELIPMFAADDVEQWGFIAHELQETLTASAATGVKDQENLIQSPNPFTLLAAVVKALQEAQSRIETLEAKIQTMELAR